MRVMAFASQKGGSGKTTLAGHIAVQAELAGAGPVAIIDTDPQGSLSDWWNARQAQTPVFAQTFISRLAQDLQKMRDIGIEILIFDTPPAITATIDQVIRVCDLVVIPTHPSPHDLRADLSDWIGPKKSESDAKESVPTAPRSAEKRVRVSLRLDVDRHLRMKLVATHLNSTMQSLFTQAIDEYFERHTPDMSDAIALLRIRERGEKGGH